MGEVQRADGAVHFSVSGEGPPLVLTHSFLCSGDMWAPVIPELDRRFRVINVDLRGHGSSGPWRNSWTIWDLAEDVVAVLDELQLASAHWCGLSIGGMLSMRAALRWPDRVDSLMILDSAAGVDGFFRRLELSSMGAVAGLCGFRPLRNQVAKNMFGKTTLRSRTELVRQWTDRWAMLDVPSMLVGLRALVRRESILPELSRVKKPTVVLVGEEDAAQPVARSVEIQEAIDGSRLVVLPKAGHLSVLETPEAVSESLLDFLAGR